MTQECQFIKVPTLLINGEFDEAQDNCINPWFRGIEKVKWITIPGATHCAHLEKLEKYVGILRRFLEGDGDEDEDEGGDEDGDGDGDG